VHFGPDTSCGAKGITVYFSEGADSCTMTSYDMAGLPPRNMQFFLSDFQPGTYAVAKSIRCPNTPGEKDFFATFTGNMNADNISGFDSFAGTVTIDYYDHVVLAGRYDVTFTLRKLGGGVGDGSFKGNFAGQHCP
jgi:hypothetical protein